MTTTTSTAAAPTRHDIGDVSDLAGIDDPAAARGDRVDVAVSVCLTVDELATAAWLSSELVDVGLADASDELVRHEVGFIVMFDGIGAVRDQLDTVRAGLPDQDPTYSVAVNAALRAASLAYWAACVARVRVAFDLPPDAAVTP